jgi:hypothetical protein
MSQSESSSSDSDTHNPNYYDLLELTVDATPDQIKKAYRKLALQHHPDKGGDSEKFRQLSEAYQILSDPSLRDKYDKSQPIPEVLLIPPLRVFQECFSQWLTHYPMVEFLLKDSCHDIIGLLNKHSENPVVKIMISSLYGNTSESPRIEQILKATNLIGGEISSSFFNKIYPQKSPPVAQLILEKKVYLTLDDIYVGKRYPHHFSITNEDLHLTGDYKMVNPEVQINIPVHHSALEIETDLQIVNQRMQISYVQKVKVLLDVITSDYPNVYRIREHDLLIHIDLPLDVLNERDVLTVPYLNRHLLSIRNPKSVNLRQLYCIDNIALPNKQQKKRGNLYVLLNLTLLPTQSPSTSLDPTLVAGQIYKLRPVDFSYLFKTDEEIASMEVLSNTDASVPTPPSTPDSEQPD